MASKLGKHCTSVYAKKISVPFNISSSVFYSDNTLLAVKTILRHNRYICIQNSYQINKVRIESTRLVSRHHSSCPVLYR